MKTTDFTVGHTEFEKPAETWAHNSGRVLDFKPSHQQGGIIKAVQTGKSGRGTKCGFVKNKTQVVTIWRKLRGACEETENTVRKRKTYIVKDHKRQMTTGVLREKSQYYKMPQKLQENGASHTASTQHRDALVLGPWDRAQDKGGMWPWGTHLTQACGRVQFNW